jgi:hypothetical protein
LCHLCASEVVGVHTKEQSTTSIGSSPSTK